MENNNGLHYATYQDCIRFHGHSCPGLAIGYRAATAAMDRLQVTRPEDEELVVLCETDACGVDAIQVISGATAGKGNLVVQDFGKNVFTFYNRKNGNAVRVYVKTREMMEDEEFSHLRTRVFGGIANESEMKEFYRKMETTTRNVLYAPVNTLLDLKDVEINSPKPARIFASIICECCGESVADAKTRIVNEKRICIPCAERDSPLNAS